MSIIQTFEFQTKNVDNSDIFNLISYIIVLLHPNVYICPYLTYCRATTK